MSDYPDSLRDRQIPLNKHGTCPSCSANWDAGEIVDELRRLQVFVGKNMNEIHKVANAYGWTPENKARFSNVIITTFPAIPERKEIIFYSCPKCMNAFDINTGTRYQTIIHAKSQIAELFPIDTTKENGSDNNQLLEDSEE